MFKWYYKWKVKSGLKMLKNLDIIMKGAGWNRQQRRQFWRDFIKDQAKDETIISLFKTQ